MNIVLQNGEMNQHSLAHPWQRLLYIREDILKLPRAVIAKKYNISIDTLYNWESGRNAVTTKVIARYLPCLKEEGIFVGQDWIMNGMGEPPIKISPAFNIEQIEAKLETSGVLPEHILMPKEINNFLNYHTNAICTYVNSDSMQPFYAKGDYVCGILVTSHQHLLDLIGHECIVLLKNKDVIVCRIHAYENDRKFTITVLFPHLSVTSHVEIVSAAEILLHRKQKGFLKNRYPQ